MVLRLLKATWEGIGMTAGQDVVYANKGVQESESRADKLHTAIEGHPNDAKVTNQLLADAHRGTPTEQRAFWQHMQIHNGTKSAETHLPEGFTVVGEDGKHVVKDKKGHTVYDEAKTATKAEHDAQIHRGEGPYAAFRRQGMTDAEAKAAAKDVKETTGKGNDGFKQGEAYTQDDKGLGNWHKKERDDAAAAAKVKADQEEAARQKAELEAKLKNSGLDHAKAELESGTDKAGGAVDKFGGHLLHTSKYLTKSDVDGALPGATGDDKVGLNYIKDHFDEMAKKSSWGDYVDAAGIAAYRQAQEAQIAAARAKPLAS